MTADQAVDFVFAKLPGQTLTALRDDVGGQLQGKQRFAWQWSVASRFPRGAVVSNPTYFGTAWSAKSARGASGRYLSVILGAHIRSDVTIGGETRPVVIKRSFIMNSYRPRQIGDTVWPAVGFNFETYGADYCKGFRGNVLAPTGSITALRSDTKQLRKELARKSRAGIGHMSARNFAFIRKQLAHC